MTNYLKKALVVVFLLATACRTTLTDLEGRRVALSEISQGKITAVVFLAAECPISQKYVRTLDDLARRYPEIALLGVFTKWDDTVAIRRYQTDFQPIFSLWHDQNHRLVRHLEATTTPEVFLLDKNKKVLYRGAIDDWYYALGQYRPAPKEHYLEDAIGAVKNGMPVQKPQTQAIGCRIETN